MVSVIDFSIYSVRVIYSNINKVSFFGDINYTNLTKKNTLPKNWLSFTLQKAKLFFNFVNFPDFLAMEKCYVSVLISGNEILTIPLSEFINLPFVFRFVHSDTGLNQIFINQTNKDFFVFNPPIVLNSEQTFDFVFNFNFSQTYTVGMIIALILKGTLKKEIIG